MNILTLAEENEELLISLRRYLHQHPELSGQEFETLKFIRDKLENFHIPYVEVENGGILGFLGDVCRGKTVLLRGDMDALPMKEAPNNMKGTKACPISQIDGVAHTCGHDAHTAMLLVAGKILKEHEDELNGSVILCFERGEEGGNNMEYILRYLEHKQIQVDACHALHVTPDIPSGKIAAMDGPVIAGCLSFDITLEGTGGHGSRPDLSNNPLDCFHGIYSDLNSVRMRDVPPYEPVTFSICRVNCGTTWNIISPTLTFSGTGRFFEQESGMIVRRRFLEILEANTKFYNCTFKINFMRGPSFGIINNKECVELARRGITEHLGNDSIYEYYPQFASESFSLMQQLYPGVYCMLGTGNSDLGITAMPHNPMFDIDESALTAGVVENISFAIKFLNSDCRPQFKTFNGSVDELLRAIPVQ